MRPFRMVVALLPLGRRKGVREENQCQLIFS